MSTRGKGFWKFNNSLTSNTKYVQKTANQNFETLYMLDEDKITDKHLRLDYLKYEIRRFTMNFSKNFVKKENKYQKILEKKPKNLYKT